MMLSFAVLAGLLLAVPSAAQNPNCGPAGAIVIAGAGDLVETAQAVAGRYTFVCGNPITVTSLAATAGGGSTVGAQRVCGSGTNADIALTSRRLTRAEGTPINPYTYRCAQGVTTRTLIEVEIYVDGLAFVAQRGGTAARCMAAINGGGVTFSQMRYVFSSYTLTRLLGDTTFDPNAVPGSDNRDGTRLWSELCGTSGCASSCPATEILTAGSPPGSGPYTFFLSSFLTQSSGGGEVPVLDFSSPTDSQQALLGYLNNNPNAVAYSSIAIFNENRNTIYAARLLDPNDNVYRFPTASDFLSGNYPAAFRTYMQVRSDNAAILARVTPLVAFIYTNTGGRLVESTGFIPIPFTSGVQMLSRLNAPGGVNLAVVRPFCGPNTGGFTIFGSSTVFPTVNAWALIFADACGNRIPVFAGGTGLGAARVCGNPSRPGRPVEIGTLSRLPNSREATRLPNGYDYRCAAPGITTRIVRLFPVCNDGISFSFATGGVAATCVAALGGLTVDQLRWMFSSFSTTQLTANGWSAASVPRSDGNEATRLWSELGGGANCAAVAIGIAGSPTVSGTYDTVREALFVVTAGETFSLARNYYTAPGEEDNPNVIVDWLTQNPTYIGYFGYSFFDTNREILSVAAVRNPSTGAFVVPSDATIQSDSYSPFARQIFMVLLIQYLTFQRTVPYARWGITTGAGDFMVQAAGQTPLSAAVKATLIPRYNSSIICFAETNSVQVMGKGETAMKDLQIGDMVLNARGKYDQIYSFGHYGPDHEANFLQIQISGVKKALEISPAHMLFVEGAAIPASALSVGDKVNLAAGGVAPVRKIKSVVRVGAYAPFTMSGTIAVNGIAASVYVDMQNDAGVLVVGDYKTTISHQFMAHVFQASHRLLCKLSSSHCKAEKYDENGISSYVAGPLAVAEWFVMQSAMVKAMAFVPAFAAGLFIYAFEILLDSKLLILIAVASVLAVFATKKSKKTAA